MQWKRLFFSHLQINLRWGFMWQVAAAATPLGQLTLSASVCVCARVWSIYLCRQPKIVLHLRHTCRTTELDLIDVSVAHKRIERKKNEKQFIGDRRKYTHSLLSVRSHPLALGVLIEPAAGHTKGARQVTSKVSSRLKWRQKPLC